MTKQILTLCVASSTNITLGYYILLQLAYLATHNIGAQVLARMPDDGNDGWFYRYCSLN